MYVRVLYLYIWRNKYLDFYTVRLLLFLIKYISGNITVSIRVSGLLSNFHKAVEIDHYSE